MSWDSLFDLASGKLEADTSIEVSKKEYVNDINSDQSEAFNACKPKKAIKAKKAIKNRSGGDHKNAKFNDEDNGSVPYIQQTEKDTRMILPSLECVWGNISMTNNNGVTINSKKELRKMKQRKTVCQCEYCSATTLNSVLSYIQLGSSFQYKFAFKNRPSDKNPCSQWNDTENESSINQNTTEMQKPNDDGKERDSKKKLHRVCNTCRQSPLHHEIRSIVTVNKSSSSSLSSLHKMKSGRNNVVFEVQLIHLFVNIRNLRSSISLFKKFKTESIKSTVAEGNRPVQKDKHMYETNIMNDAYGVSKAIIEYAQSCNSILQFFFNHQSHSNNNHISNEMTLLLTKSQNLINAAKNFQQYIVAHHHNKSIPHKQKKHDNIRISNSDHKVIVNNNKQLTSDDFHTYSMFQHKIRIIIAADALYYRIYYLTHNGYFMSEYDMELQFPNPCLYFGTLDLCFDVASGKNVWKNISYSIQKEFEHTLQNVETSKLSYKDKNYSRKSELEQIQKWVQERFGLHLAWDFEEMSKFQSCGEDLTKMDPLSFLHQNRLLETFLLFEEQFQFTSCSLPQEEMSKALEDHFHLNISYFSDKDKNYNMNKKDDMLLQHETPAPSILKEWRDSCRDNLCSLYAYATIAPTTIQNHLPNILKENNIDTILEVGCGTGYIANLLQMRGIKVIPCDIAPMEPPRDYIKQSPLMINGNEYHGITPSFCSIHKGDSSNFQRFIPLKEKGASHNQTALLLCYPPPTPSTMAEDCLTTFLNIGGSFLIYIGEFYGLTASQTFETKLTQFFTCIERIPCLSWGTDTAELTVWMSKKAKHYTFSSNLSSPLCCSYCRVKPAMKRCLKARSLVYCSEQCYKMHASVQRVHFKLHMIPHDWNNEYRYQNKKEYVNLTSLIWKAISKHKKKSKRKRKRAHVGK